jgi:hypothetical protein
LARDYLEVIKFVESMVPQAAGGTNQDDVLRARLVQYANVTIDEIDREQRWSLSYAEPSVTTTAGQEIYAMPLPTPSSNVTSNLYIKRVYYTNVNGRPVDLQRMEQAEAQRIYGESLGLGSLATAPVRGKPVKYFMTPDLATQAILVGAPRMRLMLYPTPDDTGPELSGNFRIRVAGYWKTPAIIETLGGIVSAATTLTFTTAGSGDYIVFGAGAQTSSADYGANISVRGAGFPTGILGTSGTQIADNLITTWSAIAANTATVGSSAGTTVTAAQVFFYSTNWIITHFPKLLIAGIMREIGEYYGNDQMFGVWQGRYQEQLEKLRAYEFDRARGLDMMAAAQPGQNASSQRRTDLLSWFDSRGT